MYVYSVYVYIKAGYEWATCYKTANLPPICTGHPKYLIFNYCLSLCLVEIRKLYDIVLSCLQFLMMDERIGILHASDSSVSPKKQLKPLFSTTQEQVRIIKKSDTGKPLEFIYNNFSNKENIHTAEVGVPIFRNICNDNCVTFSLSGKKLTTSFSHLNPSNLTQT